MKKYLLVIAILISLTSFSQKDREAPVISDVSASATTNYAVLRASFSDNLDNGLDGNVYQVIFQIDPIGKTWPAGKQQHLNSSYWGATDFNVSGYYVFTPDDLNLSSGQHTLRVTAYDRARNETSVEIQFTVF